MKNFLFGVLAFAVFQAASVCAQVPDAEARYQALVAAVKSGSDVDWAALRFAYADRPGVAIFATDNARGAMSKALAAEDWPAVLATANAVLDKDFSDAKAHRFAAYAYKLTQRSGEAARELAISDALLKSIETGDGLTPETAFTVVAVHEEYDLMLVRGWRKSQQSLQSHNGHAYDVMDVTTRDGKSATYYFQIDRVMQAEAALMAPK